MDTLFVKSLIERGEISSELELERATLAARKLRLAAKQAPSLKVLRSDLIAIIESYERTHWSNEETITDAQIQESDDAEMIAELEMQFYNKRKALIKSRIKSIGLKQQEFGQLLGHNSKSYTSGLINGVHPFTPRDLRIIHELLKIELNDLLPPIGYEDQLQVHASIDKLRRNGRLIPELQSVF